ncbi:DUF4917 family protein [Nostoc sp.]|uniref:DUF4917 family protein n=1 Tax=Nostoc sp. TaxID=1180 RepID=UPI002FF79E5D
MGSIDEKLNSWDEIKSQFDEESGILIGNGFSCAVWEKFQYPSLYEKASSSTDIEHSLSREDVQLFKVMSTNNFERILSMLSNTSKVNKIFSQEYMLFDQRHEHIKTALGEAIKCIHVPWEKVNLSNILPTIRQELKKYRFIYSTNYDLLIYWAIMSDEHHIDDFKDFFWNSVASTNSGRFDITNTNIHSNSTRVLYLHGALHLYRDPQLERTYKLKNNGYQNLLEMIDVPLFITEGSSEDKLRAINSSDYLFFAYNKLLNHDGSLVIFGHSLSDTDEHLVKAIRKSNPMNIAISIRSNNSPDTIRQKKANLYKRLCDEQKERPNLLFFDAQTHPLGSPDIKIE